MGGAINSCNAYAEGGRLFLTTAGADAVRLSWYIELSPQFGWCGTL